ncbi:hypothetical protein CNECB9_1150018 [Cupriavidus necator]|uniref:Uncharacterized protein n=1 Tax=Cupriavidus necator TaxID=106590 RepID=A0A1K0IL41_CUPNE|nr:hypothetical protein CNECB9_1150018 [Cupriavidus necator]
MGAYARRYAAAEAAGQMSFAFGFAARREQSHRARVLEVIEHADRFLTGNEVMQRAGISYKQTLNALCFLHNEGRVARDGRKFKARWGRAQQDAGHAGLEGFFRGLLHT